MTDDTMSVQALLEKSADADCLREMIGASYEEKRREEKRPIGWLSGTAIVSATGRRGPAPSN
jgi:hypothetical protein